MSKENCLIAWKKAFMKKHAWKENDNVKDKKEKECQYDFILPASALLDDIKQKLLKLFLPPHYGQK